MVVASPISVRPYWLRHLHPHASSSSWRTASESGSEEQIMALRPSARRSNLSLARTVTR